MNFEFDLKGYDVLIREGNPPRNGFGLMYKDGIRVWKYEKLKGSAVKEIQLFP